MYNFIYTDFYFNKYASGIGTSITAATAAIPGAVGIYKSLKKREQDKDFRKAKQTLDLQDKKKMTDKFKRTNNAYKRVMLGHLGHKVGELLKERAEPKPQFNFSGF